MTGKIAEPKPRGDGGIEQRSLVLWAGEQEILLAEPDFEFFNIAYLCRALARMPRFSGQLERNVTVAHHTLLCMEIAGLIHVERLAEFKNGIWDKDWYLAQVLLHDFPEALLCDLPRPIRRLHSMNVYNDIHRRLDHAMTDQWNPPDLGVGQLEEDNDRNVRTFHAFRKLMEVVDYFALEAEVHLCGTEGMRKAFSRYFPEWKEPTPHIEGAADRLLALPDDQARDFLIQTCRDRLRNVGNTDIDEAEEC